MIIDNTKEWRVGFDQGLTAYGFLFALLSLNFNLVMTSGALEAKERFLASILLSLPVLLPNLLASLEGKTFSCFFLPFSLFDFRFSILDFRGSLPTSLS